MPIPCIYTPDDTEKKNPIVNKALLETMKKLIRSEENVDFWWTDKHDKSLADSINQSTKSEQIRKSSDIFDIWFDSGSSFNSVLDTAQSSKVADLYCEGIDQFSGWFQSSLLLSVALKQQAPYRNIMVHGFVVDEHNRKMSKSVGNVIEPAQAITGNAKHKLPQSGLDTLRFWVAHEYYKPHIQIGGKIMEKFIKRAFDIRSLLRFVVGNLNDLTDLDKQLIAYEDMLPIDKYILSRLQQTFESVNERYLDMQLNKSVINFESFFLTDLSSFYIRSTRDRLYCDKSDSLTRRSAQTALYHILVKSLLMIGPIMPHLAEESFHYSILGKQTDSSLFRSDFGCLSTENWANKEIDQLFELVFCLRDRFFEQIKTDNAALYDISLECDENAFKLLTRFGKNLDECFGCASICVKKSSSVGLQHCALKDGLNYSCLLTNTKTKKSMCARCRRYNSASEISLCDRCDKIVNAKK